jgi:anti-anti-sigma factor
MTLADSPEIFEHEQFIVARLRGDVDTFNALEIETELTCAVSNTASGLIVDLTNVSFMDSSGMRLLFDLGTRLERRQQELRLVLPHNSYLFRTLSLVQLPDLIHVFEDLAAAVTGKAPLASIRLPDDFPP